VGKNNKPCILITGGTGKLGQIYVKELSELGYDVVFTSRSEQKIRKLYDECSKLGFDNKILGIPADLVSDQGVNELCSALNQHNIYPTTLVNNARSIEFLALDSKGIPARKSWYGEMLLDVVIPYELSISMAEENRSRLQTIVNVASMYGVVAANPSLYDDPIKDSPIQYSVAKAALIHLTKELSVRLAKKQIRVNSISYGGVEGRVDEEFKQRYAKLCPTGEMLQESHIVGAVHYLASNLSVGVTGHNLVVDGGWSVW